MKTMFNVKVLLTAVSGALLLTACGGGGAGSGSSGSGGSAPGSQSYVSGKAIDGYLVGAKVCIDVNDNGQCDPGEPSTITRNDGSYSLAVDGSAIGKKLLVEVTPDTKDLSRPGQPFQAAFTLSTYLTAESVQHVTPLTSLVAAQMDSGLSRTDAERAVVSLLGGSINLKDDYVAKGDGQTSAFAQSVVDKVTQFAKNGRTDHATVRAVLNAIAAKGGPAQVDQAAVDEQATRTVFSANVDAQAVLSGDGLFSYEGIYNAGGSPVAVREYGHIDSVGLSYPQQKFVNGQWQPAKAGEFDQNYGEYRLKADGSWSAFVSQEAMSQSLPVKRVASNVLTMLDPWSGATSTIEYRVGQVAGKPFSAALKGWVDADALGQLNGTFSAGSEAYLLNASQDLNAITVASFSECGSGPLASEVDGSPSHCNFLGDPATVYTDVKQVFELPISLGGSTLYLHANGTGEFRGAGDVVQVGTDKISWAEYRGSKNVLVINIPVSELSKLQLYDADLIRDGGSIVVALHNHHLKRGQLEPAGKTYSSIQFKQSVFDQLFNELKKLLVV